MAATPCAILPCPGFRESCRSLNWRTHKKQLARKSGTVEVRAIFELNPPPYPMFRGTDDMASNHIYVRKVLPCIYSSAAGLKTGNPIHAREKSVEIQSVLKGLRLPTETEEK
ncbi:hypothetical protein K7X08_020267 [Anisodus acutangulus]|uniref:Uncharacterized protein n=1 Tax=Anisodus acutangulus TaxID=402998 RepID=A0A9Q1M672_9SOLA|nr:hypothetical protein K7X08_020267 [Anisodus acutangulus]